MPDMLPPLLYPDPLDQPKLISWERAVDQISTLSREDKTELGARLCAHLPQPPYDAGPDRLILLAAARTGALTVFVNLPNSATFLELKKDVWDNSSCFHVSPFVLAQCGRFVIMQDALPANTPEARAAGGSLYVEKKQLNKLLGLRCASDAAIKRAAATIVQGHEEQFPEQPMIRREFLEALLKAVPGTSAARAGRAWGKEAPPAWKKKGRKGARRRGNG